MVPIGTVPVADRTPRDDENDAGLTSPNSAGATAGRDSACTASEIADLEDALRQCDAPTPKSSDLPTKIKDRLEVRVTAATPTTTPGGRVDLQVTLKNKSTDPLPLWFAGSPDVKFEVEAYDGKGRRVDAPPGRAPAYPKGTTPSRESRSYRITLTGGGTARLKVAWDALKWKWAPDRVKGYQGPGYPKAPAGPLPNGKYALRVVLPLMGVSEKELDVPKLAVEVGG